MRKNIITFAVGCFSVVATAVCAPFAVHAVGLGPFIFPGELDFLGVKNLDICTSFIYEDNTPTVWTGEGFHTGIQELRLTIFNSKEIPETFTIPESPTLHFSIVNGYGEEVNSIEKDLSNVFNKLHFITGDYQQNIAESLSVVRGGSTTWKVSIEPNLFSFEFVLVIHDEAGIRTDNTITNVGHALAPVVTITSGFPFKPEALAGEKTLHWSVASANEPSKIIAEDTEKFELDASKILIESEASFELEGGNLQPGEYIYTLTSDYAPACQTFKAYVYDVLDAKVSLNKSVYVAGEDKEAKMDVTMHYGYPYVHTNPGAELPTISVGTTLLDETNTDYFSDAAWKDTELDYTATVKIPLDKVTTEIVNEYKGNVPVKVEVIFNNEIQYESVVTLPFKYDSSGIENISADDSDGRNVKYYNVFGVEVDRNYHGLVITSDGHKYFRHAAY